VDYDIRKILAALPHRYPMLLVDRVVSLEPDESLHAVKAVSFNEGFFQGHFPGRPIMPGVLIVEALAQAAGILAIESLGLAGSGKLVYFMAIEDASSALLWSRACCSTCMWALSRSGRGSASSGARPCWATSWPRK
jgi:beta-hydroxyacyl-ACP dehydratase FabZ